MPLGTLPEVGSNAYLMKGMAMLGYCQGITAGAKADIIKEFACGNSSPVLLKRGPASYPLSIDRLYVDDALINDMLNDATCSIKILVGSGTGNPLITYGSVRFTDWELSFTEDGPVLERVTGEARSLTTATQA